MLSDEGLVALVLFKGNGWFPLVHVVHALRERML